MIEHLLTSDRDHDSILFENDHYVVTSALGGFLPRWLIIWPRQPAINICNAAPESTFPQIHILQSIFSRPVTDHALWFEHGSSARGNAIGCGVDYAHLHVLLDPLVTLGAFRDMAQTLSGRDFQRWESGRVPYGYDYHAFGCGKESFMRSDSQELGSQFFRRVLAELTQNSNAWNYREHAFLNNSRETNGFLRLHHDLVFSG